MLVERVVGRRSDPETGAIYHLTFKPPPEDIVHRLVQRSDDTEDKCRTRLETYHSNVDHVLGYYSDILVQVRSTQLRWQLYQVSSRKHAARWGHWRRHHSFVT